jgi:hypothetical protein
LINLLKGAEVNDDQEFDEEEEEEVSNGMSSK